MKRISQKEFIRFYGPICHFGRSMPLFMSGTKQLLKQLVDADSHAPRKVKSSALARVATAFLDIRGILVSDHLKIGNTRTGKSQAHLLNQLDEKIHDTRSGLQKNKTSSSRQCTIPQMCFGNRKIKEFEIRIIENPCVMCEIWIFPIIFERFRSNEGLQQSRQIFCEPSIVCQQRITQKLVIILHFYKPIQNLHQNAPKYLNIFMGVSHALFRKVLTIYQQLLDFEYIIL